MRYDKDHRLKTRTMIIEKAAQAFAGKGYAVSGIKDVMQQAGLTNGGFYAHFQSKEELLEEVLALRLHRTVSIITEIFATEDTDIAITSIADFYLSTAHRDNPREGCLIPRLASEMPDLSAKTSERYDSELELMAREVARHVPLETPAKKREWALGFLAMLVGGLVLSRSIDNKKISDEVLTATRNKAKELVQLYK